MFSQNNTKELQKFENEISKSFNIFEKIISNLKKLIERMEVKKESSRQKQEEYQQKVAAEASFQTGIDTQKRDAEKAIKKLENFISGDD